MSRRGWGQSQSLQSREIAFAVWRLKVPSATCELEPKTSVSERVTPVSVMMTSSLRQMSCWSSALHVPKFSTLRTIYWYVRSMHLLHDSQYQHCGKGFKNEKALDNHINGHLDKLRKVCHINRKVEISSWVADYSSQLCYSKLYSLPVTVLIDLIWFVCSQSVASCVSVPVRQF